MEEKHPLKLWREESGLKQRAAAERLGLEVPALSRYENYHRAPSLALAAKLSEKTGIPLDKFVRQPEVVAPEPVQAAS